MEQQKPQQKGGLLGHLDWVSILAVPALTIVALYALRVADSTVAGTAVGGLVGMLYRLYK